MKSKNKSKKRNRLKYFNNLKQNILHCKNNLRLLKTNIKSNWNKNNNVKINSGIFNIKFNSFKRLSHN